MGELQDWITRRLEPAWKTKYNALSRKVTPLELVLICIPFATSMVSIPGLISQLAPGNANSSVYGYLFLALCYTAALSILFLVGLRRRVIYFSILLLLAISLNMFVGKPWGYYPTADRDEAIRTGVGALLRGEFPYHVKTHLGNLISPLPFTFILYLPMYLLTQGHTSLMNTLFITVFCTALFTTFMDTKRAHLVLPVIAFIIFADWYLLETAIQSDFVNIGLIICLSLLLIPDEIPPRGKNGSPHGILPNNPKKIDKTAVLFAVIFGCLMAMRPFVWLIAGVLGVYLLRVYGLRGAISLGLAASCVFLLWMLPFLLWDFGFFVDSAPLNLNAEKFAVWRSYDSIHAFGNPVLSFLNGVFVFGDMNATIISGIIMAGSVWLCLTRCENKLHLLLAISSCYLIFLLFYLHSTYFAIMRDYVSIAAIPLIFAFLYVDLKTDGAEVSGGP